ncbi:MAG: MFS transporter, partial [Bacteroidota bacterium]|nr:MFS transporter [Bacteroidota bacterium]
LYMLYMCGSGEFKTSHYSIATGFMSLSLMLPKMFSGYIQQQIGYQSFFAWTLFAVIPAFFITRMLQYDPAFGKKTSEKK